MRRDCRAVLALSVATLLVVASHTNTPEAQADDGINSVQIDSLEGYTLTPAIVAGDLNGVPVDSGDARIDQNTADSPFAGVGSVFADMGGGSGYMGTGTLIHGYTAGKETVRNYVLTAAHVVDIGGGEDGKGDGISDFAPGDVSFILNAGSDYSHVIKAVSLTIHPDFTGFDNPDVNDDLLIIELESPVPLGIPVYNLATESSSSVEVLHAVGYGTTGDAVNGYVSGSSSLTTKRQGYNQKDGLLRDDEGSGSVEGFLADFDGLDQTTNVYDVGYAGFDETIEGTFGNDLETTIGPGDSGGPSFAADFADFSLELGDDGMPILLGVNTFTASAGLDTPEAPLFGSIFGGMYVPAYAEWIDSVIEPVPEPGTVAILLAGIVALGLSRRVRRRFHFT